MYVISSLVCVNHTLYYSSQIIITCYVLNSSLALASSTPYTTALISLLPVMYVIGSLFLVPATPYTTHLR
jgi:hypothetical protein